MFRKGGGHGNRLTCLNAGALGDLCRILYLCSRLIDGADQASGDMGRLAHRQRGLLRRCRHFRNLVEHTARGLGGVVSLIAQAFAEAGGVVDLARNTLFEDVAIMLAVGNLGLGIFLRDKAAHHFRFEQAHTAQAL
ncbi:MAG: hypothetical protein LKM31_14015 [Sphingobium sp.]|nr:hypothetical protein [Sphingobium sp.]